MESWLKIFPSTSTSKSLKSLRAEGNPTCIWSSPPTTVEDEPSRTFELVTKELLPGAMTDPRAPYTASIITLFAHSPIGISQEDILFPMTGIAQYFLAALSNRIETSIAWLPYPAHRLATYGNALLS
jgi:hypothetical protein